MEQLDSSARRDDIKELAREIIVATDPRDERLFDAMADEFLDDPSRALAAARGRDEPTGSGFAALTPDFIHGALLLAKLVLEAVPGAILGEVARHVVDSRKESRGEEPGAAEARARARGVAKRMGRRRKPDVRRLLSIEVSWDAGPNSGLRATAFISDIPFQVTVDQAAKLLAFVDARVNRVSEPPAGERETAR